MRVVLTGAMGGGKSTLIKTLASRFRCVPEPAREILSEQRLIGAPGVPETNPELFTLLMLSRAVHDHQSLEPGPGLTVFDRGVPDMLAYARLFGLDPKPYERAAERYRYDAVLYFPPWEEIYSHDDERKISFEGARDFGIRTRQIYRDLGCPVTEVPLVSVNERMQFIEQELEKLEDRQI